MFIVPATRKAEARRSLEPRRSRSAWATYRKSVSKEKVNNKHECEINQ
jgi:hypothetical protein